MGKESLRRFKDTEEDDSSVVTREGKQPSTRRQRGAEVEMKRLMGGAPEVVSTIQTNPNTDLEISQEVVVKDEPWLRPGVIESALMPRIVQPAEKPKADVVSAEADEKALGEALGNDIWEELQKLEGSKIPAEISQIYGDQTPPFGVLELYKKLNAEKRAEYITDLRIFEEKNKQQETSETAPVVPATVEPLTSQEPVPGEVASTTVAGPTGPEIIIEPNAAALEELSESKTSYYNELGELKGLYSDNYIPDSVLDTYHGLDDAVKKSIASGDEEAQRIAMGRLDAFMTEQREGVRSEDTIDLEQKEGTPKEWRNKLRETVAWWASPSERLIRRNAELDAEVEKIGGIEKLFRTMGEKYNKLGWKSKIAVGTSLGLGAAFSAGVSVPIALACLSGIAAQRIAGLSTMYLKFEKKSHDEKWGKEKAFLKAAVYTAVMGLAIKEGIEYVSETESAHVVQKWLGEALGHFSLSGATHAPVHPAEVPKISAAAPEVATQSAAVASAPEVPHPAAVAAAGGEAAATAAAPEISGIEVTATPGHGYEYMVKRLWEDLHEKGIKLPDGADQNSDLAKLLNADEKTIDGVVHRLAQDNEFFKGDGTSAHINLDSKLTIDTKGQIWLDHKDILAPEGPVTPAYHAGAEAPHVSEVTEGKNLNIDDGTRQRAQEFVAPLKSATPLSETLTDAGSSGTIPDAQVASASSSEVSLAPVHEHSVINSSGFEISTTQPHLYTGKGDSIIAFGGQKADKLKEMLNYLKSNPDKTIIAADSSEKLRAVWSLVEGKLEQGALIEKPSFFGFLIPDTSPSPDDLGKIIK